MAPFSIYMSWRIIYIEEAKSVRLYLDNIKIEKETGELTVPLADIHTLVIDNQMISITVPLIVKCSEYNINLIICSMEHMPVSYINPFTGNFQSAMMLKKQISWDEYIKGIIHKKIIKNKIENQYSLLKHFNLNINTISKMVDFSYEVDSYDLTNREGLAAKMYFREPFGTDFKRFEEDPVNAGLNYGYSILRSQISKTIIAKGLNPSLGIFHKGYNNPFNLSDDIIEVFRPLIDEYVYLYLKDAIIFKKEHRLQIISQTTKEVYIEGKRQTIFNAIRIYLEKIIECFETNDPEKYLSIRLIHEL